MGFLQQQNRVAGVFVLYALATRRVFLAVFSLVLKP